MKTALIAIILLHGLIHLMGFVKAFGLAEISELALPISPGWGLLWFLTAIILILSGGLWMLNVSSWWIPVLIGVILSQVLVFEFWQDARFGSIPNVIILAFFVSGFVRPTPPDSIVTEEASQSPYEERHGAYIPGKNLRFFNPFEIAIDPMERLLLINIENDPDSLYVGFEPQIFDDKVNGTGLLIIAWRTDGKVDVYHQPSLTPDPEKFDIAGKGLENMVSRDMPGAFFEVNERGAQAEVRFEDIEGRLIELTITENSTRARKPFGLLAPMGMAAENPSAMPLVLLHDFYFVRRKNTELIVKINGRIHAPDKLPLPLDFSRMYFTRYSPDPLIVTLNPAFDGILSPISINDGLTVYDGEHSFQLSKNLKVPEIQKITRSYNQHTVSLAFNPAFPNLETFTGKTAEGRFIIYGEPSTGQVRGEYRVEQSGDIITIELIPSGGWIPNEKKLSLRLLYRVAPVFRQWPTTYRWYAELEKAGDGQIRMISNWQRADENQSGKKDGKN